MAVKVQEVIDLFQYGGILDKSYSPFGFINDKIDLRGFPLPSARPIRNYRISHADFTEASFDNAWIEGCQFDDTIFDKAFFEGVRDHGNQFSNCSFIKTNFRCAGIGHKGTSYQNCLFEKCKFAKTGFVRAEYDNCIFNSCNLKGVDFNASSFNKCEFIGKLDDVWFRGGYGYQSFYDDFGIPRKNKMKNVSFKKSRGNFRLYFIKI